MAGFYLELVMAYNCGLIAKNSQASSQIAPDSGAQQGLAAGHRHLMSQR